MSTDDPIRDAFEALAEPIDADDEWQRLRGRVRRAHRRQVAVLSALALTLGVTGAVMATGRDSNDVPPGGTSTSAPSSADVESIVAVEAFGDSVWVVTDRRVLRSTDAGATWDAFAARGRYTSAVARDANSILLVESVDDVERVVRVNREGYRSVQHSTGPDVSYSLVTMPDGFGFVVGLCTGGSCSGYFWRNDVNEGRWEQLNDESSGVGPPVCLTDGTCWAEFPPGSGNGEPETSRILRSTDGGSTWGESGVPVPAHSRARVVYAAGDDFIVQVVTREVSETSTRATAFVSWLVSSDGGRTFETRTSSEFEAIPIVGSTKPEVLFEAHDADSWTVASGSVLARTDDGGSTWERDLGPIDSAESMSWTNATDGWIATADRLYRTVDGGLTLVEVTLPS